MTPQLKQWLQDIDDGKAVPRSTLSQVIRELRAELEAKETPPAEPEPEHFRLPHPDPNDDRVLVVRGE